MSGDKYQFNLSDRINGLRGLSSQRYDRGLSYIHRPIVLAIGTENSSFTFILHHDHGAIGLNI